MGDPACADTGKVKCPFVPAAVMARHSSDAENAIALGGGVVLAIAIIWFLFHPAVFYRTFFKLSPSYDCVTSRTERPYSWLSVGILVWGLAIIAVGLVVSAARA